MHAWNFALRYFTLPSVHEFLGDHFLGGPRTLSETFAVAVILDPPGISTFVDHSHVTPPSCNLTGTRWNNQKGLPVIEAALLTFTSLQILIVFAIDN